MELVFEGERAAEQIDFPSVLAVIAGLSMDAVREVSRSFGDLLVVALAYISRHF